MSCKDGSGNVVSLLIRSAYKVARIMWTSTKTKMIYLCLANSKLSNNIEERKTLEKCWHIYCENKIVSTFIFFGNKHAWCVKCDTNIFWNFLTDSIPAFTAPNCEIIFPNYHTNGLKSLLYCILYINHRITPLLTHYHLENVCVDNWALMNLENVRMCPFSMMCLLIMIREN